MHVRSTLHGASARRILIAWRRQEPAARDRQFLKEIIEKTRHWDAQARPTTYWTGFSSPEATAPEGVAIGHAYQDRIQLLYVYIWSGARRRGVGRHLLEQVVEGRGFSARAPSVAAARLYRALGAVPLRFEGGAVVMRRPWTGVAMPWPVAVKHLVNHNWETFVDRPAPEEAPGLPEAEARVHGYRRAVVDDLAALAKAGKLLGRSPRGRWVPPLRAISGAELALLDSRSPREVTYLYKPEGRGQWALLGDVRFRRRL